MNREIAAEIESFLLKNSTCLISCIDYIYKGETDRYMFLYAAMWPFCYAPVSHEENTDIGNKMVYAENKLANELLNEYGGVEVYFEKNCLDESLIKMKANDRDNFIILGIDAFYCNWSPAYKDKHILHNVLIKNYDQKNNEYICIDPFSGKTCDFRLPEGEVIKGYENIRVIHFSDTKMKMSGEKAITLFVRNYNEDRLKLNFYAFRQDLQNAKEPEDIFDSNNPETCAMIRRCREIMVGRMGMSLMAYKIYETENYEKFMRISDLLYQSAELWKICIMLFMRMLIRKNISEAMLQKISDTVAQIASLEQACGKMIQT